MVQRAKSVGKLGIQANHLKSEKDGKTNGADYFKRKIKKSRSLSLDGLNPSSPRRKMSSPLLGRPPPPNVETPLRQSQPRVKERHVLPNYMKSTSSSDARKENSQVTHLQSTPAADVAKVSHRRCSTGSPRLKLRLTSCAAKYSPASAARNLKRSSNLKLVRNLTKAPGFKPARLTSAKRRTHVDVCSDVSVQKATCSSTLKETKYPEYIMLNPGGTEAEGTSVFKVCPYTYCSLNGHRHAQLPPLKRFVAARRRIVKAQKGAKVVPLIPVSFCQRSLVDKPACVKLGFEADFFVEIYAKSEKQESINFSEEGEDDRRSSPSDGGSLTDGMTAMVAYDEHGDDGLKGGIEHDKKVENSRGATETVINIRSDISQQKEEPVAGDLDEVYSLIMIHKERMRPSLSQCDVNGGDLLKGAEDLDSFSAVSVDDGWDEEDYSSSALSVTETEDGCAKDTLEYKEEKKQEKESHVCSPGLQEDGVDCASDTMSSCQTTDVLNETVEAAALAEIDGLVDERSSTESGVSFEDIDGGGDLGAQTMNTNLFLQTRVDGEGTGTKEDACLEPQVDVLSPKGSINPSQGQGEEIKVIAEPLTYAESVIVEEVGVQDEEETRAYKHASDTEIPTQLQIPGTSSEDSDEVDRSITTLGFARGQENHESYLLISARLDVSGDADNLEGFSTGELHKSEDHLEQSEEVDINNVAEPSTTDSVLNGTTLMSTKSKDMYFRQKGKSHEELSGPYMIWRINRHENCDIPDEELRRFNPRDPNYLPIVPDSEGEKIDLRHQMIDDRRNSEEWMIDHALQRAVSKLAPARKKKVELLVEAFEKVMPISQFETSIKSSSTGISQGRPIQACS